MKSFECYLHCLQNMQFLDFNLTVKSSDRDSPFLHCNSGGSTPHKFSKYNLKFQTKLSESECMRWDIFLFLFSFFFLKVFKTSSSRILFLFFLLFCQEFYAYLCQEKEYCGRYSSVGVKWNLLSVTCIVCKTCNF